MKRIAVFDFDGTITRKDTLIAFLRFAGGRARLYATLARFSPMLVMMVLRRYDNHKAKERIFAHYFKGMPLAEFDGLCRAFFERTGRSIVYRQAEQQIQRHREQGDEVVIISASIENWVRCFAEALGADLVLATRVEVEGGKLTGRFLSKNCFGKEKVSRLLAARPERASYYLIAYGDSRGDRELLEMADEQHYKPFER